MHEENIRGSVKEVLNHFENKPPKGEIVITIAGKSNK
jgi:16S rRNA (cytidine1402-2'-O)-methyltransferase